MLADDRRIQLVPATADARAVWFWWHNRRRGVMLQLQLLGRVSAYSASGRGVAWASCVRHDMYGRLRSAPGASARESLGKMALAHQLGPTPCSSGNGLLSESFMKFSKESECVGGVYWYLSSAS